jgi:hypothetical protein
MKILQAVRATFFHLIFWRMVIFIDPAFSIFFVVSEYWLSRWFWLQFRWPTSCESELYCLMHFLYSHLVATRQTPCCNERAALELMGLEQRWPNSRSRPTSRSRPIVWSIAASCLVDRYRFFNIAYLKHNWRCKLGMHGLSSAERNARYRRFFELLNNPPGLLSGNFEPSFSKLRKICSVMRQLHNRKVSEKQLLIMVKCFSFKKLILNKRNNCTFMFDVIMLFYISLPNWSNIKLCTMVDRERFSVFTVDHSVQKSGHPWFRDRMHIHFVAAWCKILSGSSSVADVKLVCTKSHFYTVRP